MIEKILIIIICHIIGDYVLSSDYIQTTKGDNWYHLFIHCILYCVPFLIIFGFAWSFLVSTFITHFIVDASRARYKFISYEKDQVLHYMCLISCIIWGMV